MSALRSFKAEVSGFVGESFDWPGVGRAGFSTAWFAYKQHSGLKIKTSKTQQKWCVLFNLLFYLGDFDNITSNDQKTFSDKKLSLLDPIRILGKYH